MKLFPILSLATAGLALSMTLLVPDAPAQRDDDSTLVVTLAGRAIGQPRSIDTPNGPVDTMAFALDATDPETGEVIGIGADCFAGMEPAGNGTLVTDITILQLAGGTLAMKSLVSVQPSTPRYPGVTHLVGSYPAEGSNNILWGTGRYEGASGRVRVSGAVDMSMTEQYGEIGFDCIFRIELD